MVAADCWSWAPLRGGLTDARRAVTFAHIYRGSATFQLGADLVPNRVQLFAKRTPGGVKLQRSRGAPAQRAGWRPEAGVAMAMAASTYLDEPDVAGSSGLQEAAQTFHM